MLLDLTHEIIYEEMELLFLVLTQLSIEMIEILTEVMDETTLVKLKTTGFAKMEMRPLHQYEMSVFLNIE